MAHLGFGFIEKLFRGGDSDRAELLKEVLVMVLARAANADSSVTSIEVETVRRIISREVDDDISAADIRIAAASEIFERAPLSAYLRAATRSLLPGERTTILRCLSEAITSDSHVSWGEVDFFNMVADALRATPAEIAGLSHDS